MQLHIELGKVCGMKLMTNLKIITLKNTKASQKLRC